MSSLIKWFSYLLIILVLFSCSKKSTNGVKPPSPGYPIICDAPAWSPDGKTIAYYYNGTIKVYKSGRYTVDPSLRGIWFINPDGTNKRMFLWGGDLPDWNPVEPKLAIVMNSQIYTIKLNGDSLTQLTFEGRNFFPDWSPDGKKIAYDSDFDDPKGAKVIWVMNADGTNKQDISQHGIGEWRQPDWSPDGESIVHLRYVGVGAPELFVMDKNGGNAKRLTFDEKDDRYPKFSPDGSKIVFSSAKESPPQIFVMDADGCNIKQLTTEGGTYPAWSPDGSKIVYVRYSDEYSSKHGQLWIMDADGSNKKQLTYDGW
jgi:TolB protein